MKLFNKVNTLIIALFAVVTIAATSIDATLWSVDKSHSRIGFEVTHFFTPVNGTFDNYDAVVNFDPTNLGESQIEVKIAVNSINTQNEKRDGHLRTPDFFNAEEFPTISFKSSEIVSTGENTFAAKGQLTIKDVTQDIELPFTLLGVTDNPFREGTKVAGITSELNISRTAFDVGTGNWASDAVIGDEVSITLNLELNTLPVEGTN